jgi:hypothetical protein
MHDESHLENLEIESTQRMQGKRQEKMETSQSAHPGDTCRSNA